MRKGVFGEHRPQNMRFALALRQACGLPRGSRAIVPARTKLDSNEVQQPCILCAEPRCAGLKSYETVNRSGTV